MLCHLNHSYVEGLAELVVRSGKDIEQLQLQGNRVRKVAATEMNQRSSRSVRNVVDLLATVLMHNLISLYTGLTVSSCWQSSSEGRGRWGRGNSRPR